MKNRNLIFLIIFLISLAMVSLLSQCKQVTTQFYVNKQDLVNLDKNKTVLINSIEMSPPEYLKQFEGMVEHAFRYAFFVQGKYVKFDISSIRDPSKKLSLKDNSISVTQQKPTQPSDSTTPTFLSGYFGESKNAQEKNQDQGGSSVETNKTNQQNKVLNIDEKYNLKGKIYLVYNLKDDPSQLAPLYSLTIGLILHHSPDPPIPVKASSVVAESRVSVSEVEFVDFQLVQTMVEQLVKGIFTVDNDESSF